MPALFLACALQRAPCRADVSVLVSTPRHGEAKFCQCIPLTSLLQSHMGCRHAEGSLPSLQPSTADLQRLPQPQQCASLLFVVTAAGGLLAGEAVFDLLQLTALDAQIKAKALQVGSVLQGAFCMFDLPCTLSSSEAPSHAAANCMMSCA